ncbi:MAG: hypothetical protein ACE5HY_01135 [Candidatus Hydrothermarchaeales archaeon]
MIKALELKDKGCKISTFTDTDTVAVCSSKIRCPKKENKFQLELSCFVDRHAEEIGVCSHN